MAERVFDIKIRVRLVGLPELLNSLSPDIVGQWVQELLSPHVGTVQARFYNYLNLIPQVKIPQIRFENVKSEVSSAPPPLPFSRFPRDEQAD